ncbi:arabinose transporter [Ramlibacter humi]|nr:arabinose transporter [Ramlibacter humi]
MPALFTAFLPLLPLMLAVFAGFFPSGMALPVVPRYVHDTLGLGTFFVGLVMGSQYVSSILFGRRLAGSTVDGRGPKLAMRLGLLGISVVGGGYFASLAVVEQPAAAVTLLIAARLVTGVAEGFIITSALAWGIARLGAAHSGKVIGWVGMALFAAYGVGAPVGSWVHERFGFAGVAAAAVLVPVVPLALVTLMAGTAPSGLKRPPFLHVLGLIKLPGLALTLGSFGYASINAFIVLLFVGKGWGGAALAFSALGAGFIVARLLVGHWPDRHGGAIVGAGFAALQAVGQLLIWLAPGPVLACIGAALTGAGYALLFQGFGVEAVRRTPPESRGAAMGGYVVFQDISMGLSGPLGGWLALQAGVDSVYLAGAIASAGSVALALWMRRRPVAA